MKNILRFAILPLLLTSQNMFAQTTTNNQYIWAEIDPSNGWVTVRLPPGRSTDPQLSFQNKSYFTCKVGSIYFTNNEVIAPFPTNAKRLNDGTTVKIADTLRTTWANKNGVDIIQDIYPVAFTKSGQIVYKWKIFNHSTAFVATQCQYLQDIQITDPNGNQQPNSNDGPIILTRWTYKAGWETFPSNGQTLSWFYIGFLHDIPNAPSFNPGLSGMGYLDYAAPLNLIKPQSLTIGDWYTMASTIFGVNPQWPSNGTSYGSSSDNATLVVFPPSGVAVGKTVEIGRTSYGTGEYERCVGTLFSVVFYPHHFVWTPSTTNPPGFYTPDSIHVEKFVFNALNTPSSNTKITLNLKNSLFITDNLGKTNIARSQVQPPDPSPGTFINAGIVGYFDWWVRADSIQKCNGTSLDTLKFKGSCGICPPMFLNAIGEDECDLPIYVDCPMSDIDPPQFTLMNDVIHHVDTLVVSDSLLTDFGLKSITWVAESGTDASKFIFDSIAPPIQACDGDKKKHVVRIRQSDTTVGGCFDFTFTDCVGHQSFTQVCITANIVLRTDTIAPAISFTKDPLVTGKWNFTIHDDRQYDTGIDSIAIISNVNTNSLNLQFTKCTPTYSFVFAVADTLKDASACIRVIDCANNSHDTCFTYTAPSLSVSGKDATYLLSLEANHPNPFSHTTTFNYTVAQFGMVRLYFYDELGRELVRIVDNTQTQGSHTIDFDGSKLASGSYIVRLENGGNVVSRRVVVEK